MSAFVRNLTIVLVALSVVAGAFIGSMLPHFGLRIPDASELRWSLVLGMPIVLFVSFVWLNQQPAKDFPSVALQSIAQIAIFLSPFWWAVSHAQ